LGLALPLIDNLTAAHDLIRFGLKIFFIGQS
jgi:hypothetical protein